jgi:hypothetical protein
MTQKRSTESGSGALTESLLGRCEEGSEGYAHEQHRRAGENGENVLEDPRNLPPDIPDLLHDLGIVDFAPPHLRTPRRRWMCLVAMCFACALASGPIGAWPTIEPLLINAGVFEQEGKATQKNNLSTVFSVAAFSQLFGSLPFGWLYDRIGGKPLSLM